MRSKIVFVTPFLDSADMARQMVPLSYDLVVASAQSSAYQEAIGEAEYLMGFVSDLIRDELYIAAPKLKLIQLLSAGYDDADINAARRASVPIANNGGANSVAVSEHAVLLMLAVSRQLVSQHAHVVAGRWRGNGVPRLFELRGKTVGIIGLGSIGKKVGRLCQAFGTEVIYYDISRLTEAEEDASGVRFRLLNELLETADIVSLHVPLNESTHHLLGEAELALMKPSAILINTSRGPVVDENALYEALVRGKILGAGLDVFEQEPPPSEHPFFSIENVILTAHMAGPTYESHVARVRNGFDNVQRVARGEPALWIIPELST